VAEQRCSLDPFLVTIAFRKPFKRVPRRRHRFMRIFVETRFDVSERAIRRHKTWICSGAVAEAELTPGPVPARPCFRRNDRQKRPGWKQAVTSIKCCDRRPKRTAHSVTQITVFSAAPCYAEGSYFDWKWNLSATVTGYYEVILRSSTNVGRHERLATLTQS
jgi:hypothetical protein